MGAHQATGDKQEQGFALVETIVALAIMALVGLMAWRGMDAMIRGRETIDRRANLDANYFQLVRQFERDCQESLRRDEIAPLFSAASTSGASSSAGNAPAISSLAAGAKNIWWIRRYRADNQDAWMIVGYAMAPSGLQRLTSRPLLRRSEAGTLWASISRDPDLISTELLVSVEVPTIVRQAFQVQTAVIGGASASGNAAASTTTNSATNSANTSPATASSSGSTPLSNATPDTQGVSMQWWIQDQALPLSRSCLMGGAL
jgi:type II secretory pathway component PulJ